MISRRKESVLDVDLVSTPENVVSGGRSTGGNFWSNIDYTLNVDTEKLGLWPQFLKPFQFGLAIG